MTAKYVHNKRSSARNRRALIWATTAAVIVVAGGYAALVWAENNQPKIAIKSGQTVSVPQANTSIPKLNVAEATFTMQLPGDWQKSLAPNHEPDHPLIWIGTSKTDNARSLAVYEDNLPSNMPVNEELPISVQGNLLIYGQLSENCSNFTVGGSNNVAKAESLPPAPSVWKGVNFICNLPRVIDNQVGTGQTGQTINSIAVSGPKSGLHRYFFLYTDHTIQPDYSAFYMALQSFRAK